MGVTYVFIIVDFVVLICNDNKSKVVTKIGMTLNFGFFDTNNAISFVRSLSKV
ncbi:hypothetical protein HYD76_00825 [Mycoplasmopsis bovis]|nr:hypothetical protein [Mycoplasmopsis bovis]QQH48592.1 hypothetical protein HYD76_00825 [Mycoplasmopsis bovis]